MTRAFEKKTLVIAVSVALFAILAVLAAFAFRPAAKIALTAPELLDLGEKYLLELNYAQAILQFELAIDIEPRNVRAILGIADAYLHLGQQDQAITALSTGFEASGNENLSHALEGVRKSVIEGYIAIAEAYEAEGLHDRAIEILRRVFEETGDEIIGRKLKLLESALITFREDYEIQWKDPEFERLIREYLGKPSGGVRYDDIKLIEEIEIWGEFIEKPGEEFVVTYNDTGFTVTSGLKGEKTGKIRSLEDLEHFTSLKYLMVNYQPDLSIEALSDIENIDCLPRLQRIDLISNNITDISVLSGLFAIERTNLSFNSITDISPISMLIELNFIVLNNNKELMSADPLRGMRKLNHVSVSDIDTVDLNVFVGMPELKSLFIVGNKNIDYSILKKLSLNSLSVSCNDTNFPIITELNTLTTLRLHGSVLTSISGIESLSNLRYLVINQNCTDISPLASLNVDTLEIHVAKDCDLTPLAKMPNLKQIIDTSSPLDRIQALLPGIEVVPFH
jgi:tetratricopeptide (TPR) repeat protein